MWLVLMFVVWKARGGERIKGYDMALKDGS